jgi:predicted ribosome quality control (RQC) complex YloA/Tae2 family protein
MDIQPIRAEIEHMRRQILRQRKEIQALQRAGISTKSAEELLARMLSKVDGLSAERDRLIGEQPRKYLGTNKIINGPIARRFQ